MIIIKNLTPKEIEALARKYAQDATNRETPIDRLRYLRSLQDKETRQQRDIIAITK